MTIDERLLAIEEERLVMEKRRDKNATLRFLMGSVLLAVVTTGFSFYINYQQEKRALLASEQEWIIPMLLRQNPDDLDGRESMINEILSLNISEQMSAYLQAQKLNIADARVAREKQIIAEKAALEEKEKQERLAEEARLLAEKLETQQKLKELKLVRGEEEEARAAARAAEIRAARIEQLRVQEMSKRFTKDVLPF